MFRHHEEKKAYREYQAKLATWQKQRDAYANLVTVAETYAGEPSSEIMLKPGEAVFAAVAGVALVEDRRGPGEWKGRSQGFSIPVASIHGRSIRYRVGSSRGHFQQGSPAPTAIDVGMAFITNRRLIFRGARQTRECLFDKLVGFQHDDAAGRTIFAVSNRQKPTCIHYGPNLSDWFDFRLDLAIAHYRGTVDTMTAELKGDLAALDAGMPVPPPPPTS
ncbi:MAG: hypothetical protein ACYDCS_14440 [Candidatus Dormibacteria bacterium]